MVPAIGAVLAFAGSGCTSAPHRPLPLAERVPESAHAVYRDASRLVREGRRSSAQPLLEALVESNPLFVAAHRQLQNLELRRGRRGELLARYGRLVEEHPDRAEATYLRARLWSDPERQEAGFRRACAVDPSCPWPYLGLGHVAMARGDLADAERAFARGLKVSPGHDEIRLGLAEAHFTRGRLAAAAAVLAERPFEVELDRRAQLHSRIAALQGRDAESFAVLADGLRESPRSELLAAALHGRLRSSGDLDEAARVLALLAPDSEGDPFFDALRAEAARIAGWTTEALLATRLATDANGHALRRRLLVDRGRYAEAVALERARFAALASLAVPVPAYERAVELATHWLDAPTDHAALRKELAECFRSLGWWSEARAVLVEAEGAEARELRTAIENDIVLEAELRALAREGYYGVGPSRSWSEFLEEASRPLSDTFGTGPLREAPSWSIPLVGEMIDPSPRTGGEHARAFADRGRLVLFAKLRSGPPEILSLPVVASLSLGPQGAHFVFTESPAIPSLRLAHGAALAGAALHTFGYIDLAALEEEHHRQLARIRADRQDPRRLYEEPIPQASGEERSIATEPLELARKLELRALEWAARQGGDPEQTLLADRFEETMVHEGAHLEDAHALLSRPTRALELVPRIVRSGFSAASVEAWLEMRAQCAALLRARNPYLALARCAEFVPATATGNTSHGRGYQELLERILREIDRSPERFPRLEFDRLLLPQLHRLSAEQIRTLAAAIATDLNLPVTTPRDDGWGSERRAERGAPGGIQR